MHNLRWDRIGYTTGTVLLIILAGMQSNWFALSALVVVFVMMHIMFRAIEIARRMASLLDKATDVLRMVVEDMSDGDTKD